MFSFSFSLSYDFLFIAPSTLLSVLELQHCNNCRQCDLINPVNVLLIGELQFLKEIAWCIAFHAVIENKHAILEPVSALLAM